MTNVVRLEVLHELINKVVNDESQVKLLLFISNIPEDVLDTILTEGVALQCAGGLMVEHTSLQPSIDHLDGTIDSVMSIIRKVVTRDVTSYQPRALRIQDIRMTWSISKVSFQAARITNQST